MKTIRFLFLSLISFAASNGAKGQIWQDVYTDRNTSSVDTVQVKGKKYIGYLRAGTYFLRNANGDTLLQKNGSYRVAEFTDYNKDGHKDILLHHAGPSPASSLKDLFLFGPSGNQFREVLHFSDFPSAEAIAGSKYFYSYRKSGCEERNWDSDLFTINDFTATRTGTITGRQCNNRSEKDGIYIYRIQANKKQLVNLLSIETIWKYKDAQWGFIKEYWHKNYSLFQ